MSIFNRITLLIVLSAMLASGCGWIRSLRREVEDDEPMSETAEFDYYRDPANRYAPPPPANVADSRNSAVSGTPLDLSGVRAKNIRVTAKDFFAENERNENSLWTEDGQANYLFARNKLKAPGDLVSIVIEDRLRNDMVNSIKKLLPPEYRDQDIQVPGLIKTTASPENRAPAATGQADAAAAPVAAKEPSADDLLTAEVLERYPNGNLRIRGVKRIPFRNTVRNIEVVAIIKGNEIDERDMIASSKFYEHRVELYR